MSPNTTTTRPTSTTTAGSTPYGSRTPVAAPGQELHPGQDLLEYMKTYAREKPDLAALWCFGVGFVVGWKLKPW